MVIKSEKAKQLKDIKREIAKELRESRIRNKISKREKAKQIRDKLMDLKKELRESKQKFKKQKSTKKGFKFPRFRKLSAPKGIPRTKLPMVKTISRKQLGKSLSNVKERTARRILESRGASPIEKERARKLLEI